MLVVWILASLFWKGFLQCTEGQNGCMTCEQNKCVSCYEINGYHLSGSICCSKSANSFPDGNGGCTSCQSLIEGCIFCYYPLDQSFICGKCGLEYFLEDGGCRDCHEGIANCDTCTGQISDLKCTECEDGFALSAASLCCDMAASLYPDAEGGCTKCDDMLRGCASCEVESTGTVCAACDEDEGFQLSGTICCDTTVGENPEGNDTCTPNLCSAGCSVCINNATNYECVVCDSENGFHLSATVCCDSSSSQYPHSATCKTCAEIIEGCLRCAVDDGVTVCEECSEEYRISEAICCDGETFPDGNGGCTGILSVCQGDCKACIEGDEGLVCIECNEGYGLSGTECCDTTIGDFPSPYGCASCAIAKTDCLRCQYSNQQTNCVLCNESKLLVNGSCMSCSEAIPGCVSDGCINFGTLQCVVCQTDFTLTQNSLHCCSPLYFVDGPTCSLCSQAIPGCTSCYSSRQCEVCAEGFDNIDGMCCDTNINSEYYYCGFCSYILPDCQICNYEQSECLICNIEFNYFLYNQKCQNCTTLISGCTDCVINSEQIECHICDNANGYQISGTTCCPAKYNLFPDGYGACRSCPDQCQLCFYTSEINCGSCYPGYELSPPLSCCLIAQGEYPDGEGGCDACGNVIEGCQECSVNSGHTECMNCDVDMGFELSGGDCCDTNNGQFPVVAGGCAGCRVLNEGCEKCIYYGGETLCILCQGGFELSNRLCCDTNNDRYPDGNGGCGECSNTLPYCISCLYQTSQLTCEACSHGYYPASSQCQPCSPFCLLCTSENNCSVCDVGFTEHEGQCIRCVLGCTSCDSRNISSCSSCADGFYKEDRICHLCPDECLTCIDEATCLTCQNGFQFNERYKTCEEDCQFPCSTCTDVPTRCTSCEDGFGFEDSSCFFNHSCNTSSACTGCPISYFLENGKCISCEHNCDFCDNNYICLQCRHGFYKDQGSCFKCSDDCATCTSEGTCQTCPSGFYSELDAEGVPTGKCRPCSSEMHCKECRATPGQCTACADNFEFLKFACVSATRINFDLILDMDLKAFFAKVYDFKVAMSSVFGLKYEHSNLLLIKIASGSVNAQGTMNLIDESFPEDVYLNAYKHFSENSFVTEDFPILSFDLEAKGFQQPTPEEFPIVVIIVLACVVPFITGAIVFVVIRSKETKQEGDSLPPTAIEVMKNPYHIQSGT